jgi:hypothetical protein
MTRAVIGGLAELVALSLFLALIAVVAALVGGVG